MDTSAGKATIKEQKKKFHAEGCCFECERQGHIVWECPSKKTKVCSAEITDNQVETKKEGAASELFHSVQEMIVCVAKFSEEEQIAFIQGVCEEDVNNKDPGFLKA
jgi:hypothetical protein